MTADQTPVDVSGLAPDPSNPRGITEESLAALAECIRLYGDLGGITFNLQTRELVGGHQRVVALRRLGFEAAGIQWGRTYRTEQGPERDGWILLGEGKTASRFRVRGVHWPREKQEAANVAANSPSLQGYFTDGLREVLARIESDSAGVFEALRFADLRPPEIAFSSMAAAFEKAFDDHSGMDRPVTLTLSFSPADYADVEVYLQKVGGRTGLVDRLLGWIRAEKT